MKSKYRELEYHKELILNLKNEEGQDPNQIYEEAQNKEKSAMEKEIDKMLCL